MELERDLSFSCLNLSRTSLNLTNLLWLLFLFISFLISYLVSPPENYCHTARFTTSSEGPEGLSVRLSLIDIAFLLEGRFLSYPSAPWRWVITVWMALSSRGMVLRILLAQLMPFLTVVVWAAIYACCSFLWLCAERMSRLFLRSLQLRLRFWRWRGGVSNICIVIVMEIYYINDWLCRMQLGMQERR